MYSTISSEWLILKCVIPYKSSSTYLEIKSNVNLLSVVWGVELGAPASYHLLSSIKYLI